MPGPSAAANIESICSTASEVLGTYICEAASLMPSLCETLTSFPDPRVSDLGGPCFDLVSIVNKACEINGGAPCPPPCAKGTPGIVDGFCSLITAAIDSFENGTIQLQPIVQIPGLGRISGATEQANAQGPYPTMYVQFPGDPCGSVCCVPNIEICCADTRCCGVGTMCCGTNCCDPSLCCGTTCCAAGQFCCGTTCQNQPCCPPGQIACGQTCCASGLICLNGQCVCPSGQPMCGTICCDSGQTCQNGTCTATVCPPGQAACGVHCCNPATLACCPTSTGDFACAPTGFSCCASPSLYCPSTELCCPDGCCSRGRVHPPQPRGSLPGYSRMELLSWRSPFDPRAMLPAWIFVLSRGS